MAKSETTKVTINYKPVNNKITELNTLDVFQINNPVRAGAGSAIDDEDYLMLLMCPKFEDVHRYTIHVYNLTQDKSLNITVISNTLVRKVPAEIIVTPGIQ